MSFIPVQFGKTHTARLQSHPGNIFELSPSAGTELPSEPHDVVTVSADGNHFDITDLSDHFKVRRTYPRVRFRVWLSSQFYPWSRRNSTSFPAGPWSPVGGLPPLDGPDVWCFNRPA